MMQSHDEQQGYVELTGAENTARLAAHQEYLRSIGVPDDATRNLDHIGVNATTKEAFERFLAAYTVPGEKVGIYDRGDRRIAVIWRGPGEIRVELFEPREGVTPTPGFIHYAFIWPDWKMHEAALSEKATVNRTGLLNGNNIVFVATPDGFEAEIVEQPISFEA